MYFIISAVQHIYNKHMMIRPLGRWHSRMPPAEKRCKTYIMLLISLLAISQNELVDLLQQVESLFLRSKSQLKSWLLKKILLNWCFHGLEFVNKCVYLHSLLSNREYCERKIRRRRVFEKLPFTSFEQPDVTTSQYKHKERSGSCLCFWFSSMDIEYTIPYYTAEHIFVKTHSCIHKLLNMSSFRVREWQNSYFLLKD